jgi:hypothetical protein
MSAVKRGVSQCPFVDTSLQTVLIPSIERTTTAIERKLWGIKLYLGIDSDDIFWREHVGQLVCGLSKQVCVPVVCDTLTKYCRRELLNGWKLSLGGIRTFPTVFL